jgi:cytidylate kinase
VSERLGFRYLDEEIVVSAAVKGELEPEALANTERRKALIERFLERVADAGAVEAYPALVAEYTSTGESDRALIRDVIREVADEGEAVIVAHAASMALADREDILRVFVTASPETRARRVATEDGLADKAAADAIRKADRARVDYFRRFYRVGRELPTHYDLVINTDAIAETDAAGLIVHAAQQDIAR